MLTGSEFSTSHCAEAHTAAWLHLLKIFPYWIRFWQCIRRTYDKHQHLLDIDDIRAIPDEKRKLHWHLANAGKYGIAMVVTVINSFHIYHNRISTEVLAVVFGAISTLYAYSWDIYKDWGLLRWKANKEHKLLRKEVTYPASAYYIAMIVNFMLRIAWAVALYPVAFGIHNLDLMHYLHLPLSLAEIGRRCIWNLFRLENEHLNNVGEFRVVKDIPLTHGDFTKSIKINIRLEGDEDKVDRETSLCTSNNDHHRDSHHRDVRARDSCPVSLENTPRHNNHRYHKGKGRGRSQSAASNPTLSPIHDPGREHSEPGTPITPADTVVVEMGNMENTEFPKNREEAGRQKKGRIHLETAGKECKSIQIMIFHFFCCISDWNMTGFVIQYFQSKSNGKFLVGF